LEELPRNVEGDNPKGGHVDDANEEHDLVAGVWLAAIIATISPK
jgi:hypothetical protein